MDASSNDEYMRCVEKCRKSVEKDVLRGEGWGDLELENDLVQGPPKFPKIPEKSRILKPSGEERPKPASQSITNR